MEKENKAVEETPFVNEEEMIANLLDKAAKAGFSITRELIDYINTTNYDYLVEKGIAEPVAGDDFEGNELIIRKATLKDTFDMVAHEKVSEGYTVLVTACKLPSGAIEVAVNNDKLKEKVDYITGAYDKDFRLKTNPKVQIVDFILV